MFTALENNQATSALCTQFVTPLPCGVGPDTIERQVPVRVRHVQTLIGDTRSR